MVHSHAMTKAIWKGTVIAQSSDVLLVENRVYFPSDSITPGTLQASAVEGTYCHWKGDASYFDVEVDGEVNEGAAWTYAEPHEAAESIAGYFAFWKGVVVEDKPDRAPLQDPGSELGSRTGYRALCWLLERSSEVRLSATQVEEQIGIPANALASTFAHRCVQPFAKHLKWRLEEEVLHKG